VAAVVDFGFVRRLTARFYSHTGRPGLDPVVLFKLSLLGYLYGITSERRLAEEVRLHLAYRWFLGYDLDEATPDHSVLSKARARFGLPVYVAFFTEIVRQCERAGLVRGDVLYVDSTLVEAKGTGRNSLGNSPWAGEESVVPLRMHGVGLEGQLGHDGVGDRDAGGVLVEVEASGDRQAGGGRGGADEADHRLVVDQRPPPPVDGDVREEAVLDLG
jgi:transposase